MSEKRAEASRTNGSRSEGPKSPKGKNNVRFNALAGGLFAKQLVIPELGESPEEFDRIKNEIWNSIQPTDVFQEMLTIELVETWWRRQRIRRGAAAEVRLSAAQIEMEHGMRRVDEGVSLGNRFWELLLVSSPQKNKDLEEVRSRLASTSTGMEFLIATTRRVSGMFAISREALSDLDMAVIAACCGPQSAGVQNCYTFNGIIRESVQVARDAAMGKKPPNGGSETGEAERVSSREAIGFTAEACKEMLQDWIRDILEAWAQRKNFLVEQERVQKETQLTAAALPSSGTLDRISRAEAAVDRRFHRALVLLLTLKSPQGNPKFLLP